MSKRMIAMMMAGVMAAGIMTGCGSSSGESGSAQTTAAQSTEAAADSVEEAVTAGTYVYERNVLNADTVVKNPYNFGAGNVAKRVRALRVELTLEDDSSFSMNVHGWMQEDTEGGEHAVGEAFVYGEGMYAEFMSGATGTYVQDGDMITITADKATYEVPDLGVSYLAQSFSNSNASGGSFAPEGENYYGAWTSDDNASILDLFPETVFTTDGDTILSWEKAGRLTEAVGENASLVFYQDGTAYYEDAASGLTTDPAWNVADGVVTLTYSGAEGETTVTGEAGTTVEITLRQYTDATNYTDYTQGVTLTEDNIAALQ